MRDKWTVELVSEDDHMILSSGDIHHDDWVEKFVGRYIKCLQGEEHILIKPIRVKGKRLYNPVFPIRGIEI